MKNSLLILTNKCPVSKKENTGSKSKLFSKYGSKVLLRMMEHMYWLLNNAYYLSELINKSLNI